jgi:hypothetical protein
MIEVFPRVRSIQTIGDRTYVDLADSRNLYITERQGELFERVTHTAAYRRNVTAPLREGLRYLPALAQAFMKTVSGVLVFDCGPSDADSALFNWREIREAVRVSRYVVIDVNPRLLSSATRGLRKAGQADVEGRCQSFETFDRNAVDLEGGGPVAVLFGATGVNFDPGRLVDVLRGMTRAGDILCLQSIIRTGYLTSRTSFREYSSPAVREFAFEPLALLGGRPGDFEFRCVPSSDRFEFRFIANTSATLRLPENQELQRGSVVTTAFSRRPSIDEHEGFLQGVLSRHDTVITSSSVATSVGVINDGGPE